MLLQGLEDAKLPFSFTKTEDFACPINKFVSLRLQSLLQNVINLCDEDDFGVFDTLLNIVNFDCELS